MLIITLTTLQRISASIQKKYGVDDILVVSVNDTFVMNAWKEDEKSENISFIPDGNGEFTEGMGMLVGKEDLGFGKRSWRYSMLVKNGVVENVYRTKRTRRSVQSIRC